MEQVGPSKLGCSDIRVRIEQKHLCRAEAGMILDFNLDFQSHAREHISKAKTDIGMIKYLSRYLSRDILDMIPHVSYM